MFSELWKLLDVQYMSSFSEAAGGAVCAVIYHAAYFLNTCHKATEYCRFASATSIAVVFDRGQTWSDHSMCSILFQVTQNLNIFISTTQLVPKWFHSIELQEHPKRTESIICSESTASKGAGWPACLALMWQTCRSFPSPTPLRSGITGCLRAL